MVDIQEQASEETKKQLKKRFRDEGEQQYQKKRGKDQCPVLENIKKMPKASMFDCLNRE